MIRASISTAARRAASSICSHIVGAVWQNREQIVDVTACDGVDHRQRPPFKGMAFASDYRTIRNIMAMGSMWRLPSTRFRMIV